MCKRKKPIGKKLKRILKIFGIVIGTFFVLLISVILFFLEDILDYAYYFSSPSEDSLEIIDISMTEEEMLEDLDKAYEYAVLSNPNSPEFEEVYGIDFEEMHEEYRGYISECENEYDFNFVMYTYLKNIPSAHTTLHYADPDYTRSLGFMMLAECGKVEDEDKYLYSWEKYLEKTFEQYDFENTEMLSFEYVSGDYVATGKSGEEYGGSLLLSIDGKEPTDFAKDPLQCGDLKYDAVNDMVYRKSLSFNDKAGKPVTLTIENYDGEIVEKEMYVDDKLIYAYKYNQKYKDIDKELREENGEEIVEKKLEYQIAEDDENNLVYVRFDRCIVDGAEDFTAELTEAMADKDNVIVDMRKNGGGTVIFCEEVLYPCLFTDDYVVKNNLLVAKNDMTTEWINKHYNKVFNHGKIHDDGTMTYVESHYLKGKAEKDVNIYLLVSNDTCSTADLISKIFSEQENVILVGENTYGEGWDGEIFVGNLPNSHLIVGYCPGKNTDTDISDSVWGTEPDVICPNTSDAVRYKQILILDGIDADEYENAKLWDNTLQETIKMINSKE